MTLMMPNSEICPTILIRVNKTRSKKQLNRRNLTDSRAQWEETPPPFVFPHITHIMCSGRYRTGEHTLKEGAEGSLDYNLLHTLQTTGPEGDKQNLTSV